MKSHPTHRTTRPNAHSRPRAIRSDRRLRAHRSRAAHRPGTHAFVHGCGIGQVLVRLIPARQRGRQRPEVV